MLFMLGTTILISNGCAPDDREWEISTLTIRHQQIFQEAVTKINSEKENAHFSTSREGISTVTYDGTVLGKMGSGSLLDGVVGRIIDFGTHFEMILKEHRTDKHMLQTMIHELCHALTNLSPDDHINGNPQGGNCLDSIE